jgi:hypothetical protein
MAGNVRLWIMKYSRFLEFEGLEDHWYRYLQLSCPEEKDYNIFETAKVEGTIDPSRSWKENIPLIEKIFLPLCTRGQVLKRLIELKPFSGETLADYSLRFKLTRVEQMKIDDWVYAELFVLSLPEWLKTVLHRNDLNVVSYDSFDEVLASVKKIVVDNPQRPLISSTTPLAYQTKTREKQQ